MSRTKSIQALVAGILLVTGLVIGLRKTVQAAPITMYPADQFAWGTNIGWLNFKPSHGGVTVYPDHLEGYAWSETIGWIRLGTHTGLGCHTYSNTSPTDYGVNHDGQGTLSGYAWSTNAGWVNFSPSHESVTLDLQTGSLDGYAWGENIGWIHFKNTDPAYQVTLEVTECTLYLPLLVKQYP